MNPPLRSVNEALIISNPCPFHSNRAPKRIDFHALQHTKDGNIDRGNQLLQGLIVLVVSLGKVHGVHFGLDIVLLLYIKNKKGSVYHVPLPITFILIKPFFPDDPYPTPRRGP